MIREWGYSGRVGEWHITVPGGRGDDLNERSARFLFVLDCLVSPLKDLHRLHRAKVDFSILDEQLEIEQFHEDVELDLTDLEHVPSAFEQLLRDHRRSLITRVVFDLDTRVVENTQEVLMPESAELYIGTASDAMAGQEVNIFVSYSALIDVWLKKTFGPQGEIRDNTDASESNHPRLQRFLNALAEKLGGSLEKGESVYYSDFLQDDGFIQK